MRALTFRGGVHPLHGLGEGKSLTRDAPLREYIAHTVVIPMIQHIGAYCVAAVQPGDAVKIGQLIGAPQGLGAPIHASVSGKVVAVEPRPHVTGLEILSVIIENDDLETLDESISPYGGIDSLPSEKIRQIVFDAGMVGMGGAAFPTHVKLNLKPDQKIEYLILNGSECEPYLTCDYRTMVETPHKVVAGARALQKAVDAKNVVIGVEDNKPEAIAELGKAAVGTGIVVQPLKTKYPEGGEKQLIYAVTKRRVSAADLPATAGCLVVNVATAAQIAGTIETGVPLVKRAVTVTGRVNNPGNLILRVGTTFRDAIDFCGGLKGEVKKVVSGGPMMGFPIANLDCAVTKGTSGILALGKSRERAESNCIKCGRCIEACPMGIQPTLIDAAYLRGEDELMKSLDAVNCIKCGCCSYVCPAARHLTQTVDLAKRRVMAKSKK